MLAQPVTDKRRKTASRKLRNSNFEIRNFILCGKRFTGNPEEPFLKSCSAVIRSFLSLAKTEDQACVYNVREPIQARSLQSGRMVGDGPKGFERTGEPRSCLRDHAQPIAEKTSLQTRPLL